VTVGLADLRGLFQPIILWKMQGEGDLSRCRLAATCQLCVKCQLLLRCLGGVTEGILEETRPSAQLSRRQLGNSCSPVHLSARVLRSCFRPSLCLLVTARCVSELRACAAGWGSRHGSVCGFSIKSLASVSVLQPRKGKHSLKFLLSPTAGNRELSDDLTVTASSEPAADSAPPGKSSLAPCKLLRQEAGPAAGMSARSGRAACRECLSNVRLLRAVLPLRVIPLPSE